MLHNFSIIYEKEDFDKVSDSIENSITFTGTNLWILVFAIFIASLGLNVNSTAVIIGAMLISPLMGPIMGIGYSMAINDLDLLKKSFRSYLFAAAVGLITSTIYFCISPLNQAHSEILARTSPNIYDVFIALFGGLAGMLATSSKLKGNVIPGVAIATALMPPLCTAGFGLATLNYDFFFGAFYLFIINTVFIALSTLVVARFLHFPYKHLPKLEDEAKSRRIIWGVAIITMLPSIYLGYDLVVGNKYLDRCNNFITQEANFPNDYLLQKTVDVENKRIALVYGGDLITENQIDSLRLKLSDYKLEDFTLEIKQGFAYLQEKNNKNEDKLTVALSDKDKVIQMLQLKLDSISQGEKLSIQIFKELKAQLDEVQSLSLEPATTISEVDSLNTKIWIAIISSQKSIDKEDKIKIERWLKTRINAEQVRVFFETKEPVVAARKKR